MKNSFVKTFLVLFTYCVSAHASINAEELKDSLLKKYEVNYGDKKSMALLKEETLSHGGKSVEALIEVMKNAKYPDKNRWMATFLLGQIMGDKSAPFLAKFLKHPHWVMRMASLKTLLALKQTKYESNYIAMLSDDSFLVRYQALENIRTMNMTEAAPQVWAMLYDKKNYYVPELKGKPLKARRSNIIKNIITTVGDLRFDKAKDPLLKMIQKDRYKDIFNEMDATLGKLYGLRSPDGDMKSKRLYWQRMTVSSTVIN
jgi:hypothetical protein